MFSSLSQFAEIRTKQDRRAKMYLKQHLQFTKNVFLFVQVEIYGLNLRDAHISLAEQGIDPLPSVCQQP